MRIRIVSSVIAALALTAAGAAAEPEVSIEPKTVHPGDPVLVTVTGEAHAPKGNVGDTSLVFFPAKRGYQAVFAVPLDTKPTSLSIQIDGAPIRAAVTVEDRTFPQTDVIVEDELANPPKPDRDRIDADNKAIIEAAAKSKGAPQFVRAFRRPPGEVTSVFGEWRTFNDGHRSQHLGTDFFAKEGTRVRAIDAGTVVLVRDTFLAGNIVVIAHGGGIASAYYHLSKSSVAEGDTVKAGEEIGRAGHTGRTTGPHLHLSVRVPGGFVDPIAFFKLKLAPAPGATGAE
jgi:murein DD-endopeptidase MepM/ murein hydrolase activator NlpD